MAEINNENLMGQGGSYIIDPKTHDLVLKERTLQPHEVADLPIEVNKDPVASVEFTADVIVDKKPNKDK